MEAKEIRSPTPLTRLQHIGFLHVSSGVNTSSWRIIKDCFNFLLLGILLILLLKNPNWYSSLHGQSTPSTESLEGGQAARPLNYGICRVWVLLCAGLIEQKSPHTGLRRASLTCSSSSKEQIESRSGDRRSMHSPGEANAHRPQT